MTRLALSDDFTKYKTKILCLQNTVFLHTQEYFTCDHKHIPKMREIMSVFPNISNIINSIDVVAKTCGG